MKGVDEREKQIYELRSTLEKIVRQLEYRLSDIYRQYKEGKRPEDIVNGFLLDCKEYPVFINHHIVYFRETDNFILKELEQ